MALGRRDTNAELSGDDDSFWSGATGDISGAELVLDLRSAWLSSYVTVGRAADQQRYCSLRPEALDREARDRETHDRGRDDVASQAIWPSRGTVLPERYGILRWRRRSPKAT